MSNRNEYMRAYLMKRRHERRLIAIMRLGGRCARCRTDEVGDLRFHYLDPSTQSFPLKRMGMVSEERFDQEVPKLELLCRSCEVYERIADNPCGTVTNYRRGCRCDLCREANREHNVAYNRAHRMKT